MTIGTILKRLGSYQRQQEALLEWAANWEKDQTDLIYKLRWAAQHDDHGKIMHMIDQLDGATENRFAALNNVLRMLSDPDRKLKDMREYPEESPTPVAVAEPDPPVAPPAKLTKPKNRLIRRARAWMSRKWSNVTTQGCQQKNLLGGIIFLWTRLLKSLLRRGYIPVRCMTKLSTIEIGKTEKEIADLMGLGKSAMSRYAPYKKGMYNS